MRETAKRKLITTNTATRERAWRQSARRRYLARMLLATTNTLPRERVWQESASRMQLTNLTRKSAWSERAADHHEHPRPLGRAWWKSANQEHPDRGEVLGGRQTGGS